MVLSTNTDLEVAYFINQTVQDFSEFYRKLNKYALIKSSWFQKTELLFFYCGEEIQDRLCPGIICIDIIFLCVYK